MKRLKMLAASAALATVLVATSASATTLLVSYAPTTGPNDAFTFQIDSNPFVVYSVPGLFFTARAANGTGEYAGQIIFTGFKLRA